MRELFIGETSLRTADGRPLTCTYHLIVRTVDEPVSFESYGVAVRIPETGEEERVFDITVSPARIEALTQLLLNGSVTPCTLEDVIEDWLAQ